MPAAQVPRPAGCEALDAARHHWRAGVPRRPTQQGERRRAGLRPAAHLASPRSQAAPVPHTHAALMPHQRHVPPPQPEPCWGPEAVCLAQLEALQAGDAAGVFCFASLQNQAATGPVERFAQMLQARRGVVGGCRVAWCRCMGWLHGAGSLACCQRCPLGALSAPPLLLPPPVCRARSTARCCSTRRPICCARFRCSRILRC